MSGDELTFIRQAFESNYIAPTGPMVDAFEQEFAEKVGLAHALALSSGTAAMHLALRLLGVGQGDEVFASTLTFVGSVTPITFEGAVPVFIDSDRESWNMDPDLLADELASSADQGRLPGAVVVTEIYGQCADLDRIKEACRRYKIPIIVDSAEALGATYICDCSRSSVKAAVFSFNGNKILTTSGGGMLASDDGEFIEKARFLSQQARDAAPHYEHSEIGFNYRLSNVLAAIGRGQLRVLEERVRRKREIFDFYKKALGDLPGIAFMPEAPYGTCNRWLTVILITPEQFGADREQVRLALEAENIESRPVWKPMHAQPVFQVERQRAEGMGHGVDKGKYRARVVGGAVAEDLFARGLCLPSGTAMSEADMNRVVSVIRQCRE